MEKVSVGDAEPNAFGSDIDRRGLSAPLGTTDLALNRSRLDPGERFSGEMHAHVDREEVFGLVEGEATFETVDGEVTVGEAEVIRFAPEGFQSGKNGGDGEVVAFAMGAPRDSEDVRIPQNCPECDHDDVRATPGADGFDLECPDCGVELDG